MCKYVQMDNLHIVDCCIIMTINNDLIMPFDVIINYVNDLKWGNVIIMLCRSQN